MRKILAIALLFNCSIVIGQNKLNLVPVPEYSKIYKGNFNLSASTQIMGISKLISLPDSYKEKIENSLPLSLKTMIQDKFGVNLAINNTGKVEKNKTSIGFYTLKIIEPNKDRYELRIDKSHISISSNSNAGLFYGIQTLLQIIEQASSEQKMKDGKLLLPQVTILDAPRFPYRGMHLDVCRHFFPVSFVKKYIDYLAAYKFNKFHWHLTEDQGWRIEIKKYPELITIGSNRNGTLIGRYPGKGNDNKPYGGFYTQAEIKEVVQYAAARYIDVIPEIEMPGHSSAAIAAYPWLSCFPQKPTEIPAKMISQKSMDEQKAGRIKLVQETWGVFDDVYCAGKDSTFKFLENVIDEVSTLFPSKYFHIGGDESPKAHWKLCPACQKRMKDNNLKDEHELQSWFVQRIEKYLNSKGKTMIGWDEILEGGLAPNAVVMSWRGEKGGIEAARQKHQVIMTPGNPVYFDHTQSKNEDSVTFGGYNPIENVYAYEPVSKELNTEEGKYILGAQANMWTEYQSNPRKIEYQLFPRITALSEVLWSPKEKRDWKDFERRLPVIFERLDKQKINYSKAYYDLKATVEPIPGLDGYVQMKLESKLQNARIKYKLNNGDFYGYIKPIALRETVNLSFSILKDSQFLKISSQKFSFNKATGKKITLTTEADKKYPGDGAFTLVNGVQNEKGMLKSSEFLGFNGTDMEALIDLGKTTEISNVIVHVLEQNGSWIYLPSQVKVIFIPDVDFTENDLKNFPSTTRPVNPVEDMGAKTISVENIQKCRYIKVTAKNFGLIPAGKPGAGNPAWLFVDEIEVR
jgi:hexosaminidase